MWIDFEGIDGSGKSTISVRLAHRLRDLGLAVHHVREQGAFRSPIALRIRELTRDTESVRLTPEAELLLNAARETQLLEEEIRPALARGEVVLTDRALYSHSILAQRVRGLPVEAVDAAVRFASRGLWPDAVIYVDVDPDVARLRKRLRKIREKRFGSSSRKGLLGQSLARLSRQGFLALAAKDPARWRILDNSGWTPREAEQEALALAAPLLGLPDVPRPAPATGLRLEPAETLDGWVDRFLDFAEALGGKDPAAALLYLAGLPHPRADALRKGLARHAPDVAAWTVSGDDSPAAWEIRETAVGAAPFHVARGLNGLDDDRAWSWRERLAGEVPDQVLHSLGGLAGERAHGLRRRLWAESPDEGLRSLAGLVDETSWEFRRRAMERYPSGAVAESLSGIDQEPSWPIRHELRSSFPVSVLRSLRRVRDERGWPIREELADAAPRAVLETVVGFSGPQAEGLRLRLQEKAPDEVAASLWGLDTAEAWRRRRDLLEAAPAGVLSSLYGMRDDLRAQALVLEILSRAHGRPRLVRKAAMFRLKPPPAVAA